MIGVNQTGRPNLASKRSRPWQTWCVTTEDALYHRNCDDESAATFVVLLGSYQGHVLCDALATHGAGAREGPEITLAGRWRARIDASRRRSAPTRPRSSR